MNDTDFLSRWDVSCAVRRTDLEIPGSPNRSVERFAFEDAGGHLYIAEGFDLRKTSRQNAQNELLEFLADRGLPVMPWIRTRDGKAGAAAMARYWQLRHFADADPLPRKNLGNNRLYAGLWEDFLCRLEAVSHDPELPAVPNERFLFTDYLPHLEAFVRRRMPDLSAELAGIMEALTPFFHAEPDLPVMLAHGDYHPGNTLVKGERISCVIDWEFVGWKTAGYDLALLTGCLGMDDPLCLTEGAAAEMRNRLLSSPAMPEEAKPFFPDLIAAVRLGWLGEWIDLNDRRMAMDELRFIRLLLELRENFLNGQNA